MLVQKNVQTLILESKLTERYYKMTAPKSSPQNAVMNLASISRSSPLGQYDTVVDPRSLSNDQFRELIVSLLDNMGLCVVANKSPERTYPTVRVARRDEVFDAAAVAKRVSKLRESKGIGIVCLAHNAMITPPTLVDIERGERVLTPAIMQNLARALNVQVSELVAA
jgi:hypothetical protein